MHKSLKFKGALLQREPCRAKRLQNKLLEVLTSDETRTTEGLIYIYFLENDEITVPKTVFKTTGIIYVRVEETCTILFSIKATRTDNSLKRSFQSFGCL